MRQRTRARQALRCLAILAGGLTLAPFLRAGSGGDARGEVAAALQEYVRLVKATDAAGLSAFYAADGELLEPGMEALKGPEAIRKFLESFGTIPIESSSMDPEATEIYGDQAFQWGRYAQRVAPPGKPAADYRGRFVVQWSRQTTGKWLIRRLLVQPSPNRQGG